jgi:hypothetical protein
MIDRKASISTQKSANPIVINGRAGLLRRKSGQLSSSCIRERIPDSKFIQSVAHKMKQTHRNENYALNNEQHICLHASKTHLGVFLDTNIVAAHFILCEQVHRPPFNFDFNNRNKPARELDISRSAKGISRLGIR